MILDPGTFNVNQFRRAIPAWVKIQVLLNMWTTEHVQFFTDAKAIEFDHNPALTNRPYDTDKKDFIPPQHDPAHIEAKDSKVHDHKTFGRKPDASKTVSTRGSDVGERSRTSDIRATEALHKARLASKGGHYVEAAEILASARFKKKHTRPKAKIPQRKNPWPKRKMGAT